MSRYSNHIDAVAEMINSCIYQLLLSIFKHHPNFIDKEIFCLLKPDTLDHDNIKWAVQSNNKKITNKRMIQGKFEAIASII